MNFQPGQQVWVESSQGGYPIPGEIREINERNGVYKVKLTAADFDNKTVDVNDAQRLSIRNTDQFDVKDLLQIQQPCDATMLYSVKERLDRQCMLSRLGNCGVFVNVHRPIEEVASAEVTNMARTIYHKLATTQTDQSIIMHGEAGAGKSDLMKQLCTSLARSSPKAPPETAKRTTISEETLRAALRVTESLFNARTQRNNNASRYGMHVQLYYKRGYLWSAHLKQLCLDADRLVLQSPGERTHHVFYEMLNGLRPEQKAKWGLLNVKNYFFLNQGKCVDAPGRDDTAEFRQLESQLEMVGFSLDQQQTIWKVLAAILHLGNVFFRPIDGSDYHFSLGSKAEIQWVAVLLQLDPDELKAVLMPPEKMKARQPVAKTEINMGHDDELGDASQDEPAAPTWSIDNALDMRDSLCKALYAHLCDWVIGRINHYFFKPDRQQTINLLDMPGFERYQGNGFEQFVINLVAERQQQHFADVMFTKQQKLYAAQKLDWEQQLGVGLSNAKVLDLLLKRPFGVVPLLDDEGKFPKGTDGSFLQKIHINHANKSAFGKPRNKDKPEFCVKHFAGPTWYSVNSFLRKNREEAPDSVLKLLRGSQSLNVTNMFRSELNTTKTNGRKKYVVGSVDESVQQLLKKLTETKCWFMLCVRANQEKSPDKIDMSLVYNQMRALGISEVAKILQTGFPVQYDFHSFMRMYRCVLPPHLCTDRTDKEIVYLILNQQGHRFSNEYQMGVNKVFMREKLSEHLTKVGREAAAKSAVIIQKNYRSYRNRKSFTRKRQAAIRLQAQVRGLNARARYIKMKEELLKEAEKEAVKGKTMKNTVIKVTEPTKVQAATNNMEFDGVPDEVQSMLRKAAFSRLAYDDVLQHRVDGAIIHSMKHQLPTDLHKYPFEKFAEENFKGHTWAYRREPIVSPFLTKDTEEEFERAVTLFRLVLRYMNMTDTSAWCEILLANYIIQMALDTESLRDELYVQLINQTKNNNSQAIVDRMWSLMAVTAATVVPSEQLLNYVLSYIGQSSTSYRSLIVGRLLHSSGLQQRRRMPPCWLEHGASAQRHRMAVPAFIRNDERHNYQVESWCSAQELAHRILKDELVAGRGLPRSGGWSVQVENDQYSIDLLPDNYVLDAISHLEHPDEFPTSAAGLWLVAGRTVAQDMAKYRPKEMLARRGSSNGSVPSDPNDAPISRGQSHRDSQAGSTRNVPLPPDDGQSRHSQLQQDMHSAAASQKSVTVMQPQTMPKQVMFESQHLPQRSVGEMQQPQMVPVMMMGANGIPQMNMMPASMLMQSAAHPQFMQQTYMHQTTNGQGEVVEQEQQNMVYAPPSELSAMYARINNGHQQQQTSGAYVSQAQASMAHDTSSQAIYQTINTPARYTQNTTQNGYEQPNGVKSPTSMNDYRANMTAYANGHGAQVRPVSSVSEQIYAPVSNASRAGRYSAVPPSEMSFSSRVRRMQIPSKNSDVDKFLDDIFEPVLGKHTPAGAIEEMYDTRNLVATIKGGADGATANAQQPQQQLPQQQPVAPSPMMFMMMPSDGRMSSMFGMPTSAADTSGAATPVMMMPMMMMMPNGQMTTTMANTQTAGMMAQPMSSCVTPLVQVKALPADNVSLINMPQIQTVMTTANTTAGQKQTIAGLANDVPNEPTNDLPPEPSYPPPVPQHGFIKQSSIMANTSVNNRLFQSSTPSSIHYTSAQVTRQTQVPSQASQSLQMDFYPETPTGDTPRLIGRLPMVRPHEDIKLRELEAIERMKLQSDGLPPPVDEVKFWRPMERSYIVYEDGRVVENVDQQNMQQFVGEQWQGPPPTDVDKTIIERKRIERTPTVDYSVDGTLKNGQPEEASTIVDDNDKGDWIEDTVNLKVNTMQRKNKKLGHDNANDLDTIAKDRRADTGAVMTYANPPWKITLRKEMFYPNEEITDEGTLDLIYQQIIRDVMKDEPPFRIRSIEKDAVWEIFRAYQVPLDEAMHLNYVPVVVKRVVVDAARQWPLYFCRMYSVVEDRHNEYVAVLLGVSESGIRLIARDYDSVENPLAVLDHFDYDDLLRVDLMEGDRLLRIVTRRGLEVRLYTDYGHTIKQLIDTCVIGPMQGKEFVRAVSNYLTRDASLLKFMKGDIIEISEAPIHHTAPSDGQAWAYGKIHDLEGFFPLEYTEPLSGMRQPYATLNNSHPIADPKPTEQDQWVNANGTLTPTVSMPNGQPVGKYTMMEYAMLYFRNAPVRFEMQKGDDGAVKGTLKVNEKKSKKEWTWKDVADQVKFTKDPINHSLTRLEGGDKEMDKLAVECFLNVMRYMGDYPCKKQQSGVDCMLELLMCCYRHSVLRDEVYAQIMKQTTNNKSSRPDSAIRGWRLFSMLTAYFDCSDNMRPYLTKYLQDAANDTRRAYHGTAMVCLQNLHKTFKYGGRKYMLGGKEVEAVTLGKHLKRQIYHLPGGHKKVINTKSTTVVEEIIQDLCEEMNIRSAFEQQEFCLCYILESDNTIKLLSNDDYVLDVVTELEQKHKDFFLLLKRTAWLHPLRLDSELYIDVMFFQVVPDYLEGLLVVMRSADSVSASVMDDMATLAALLHYADEDGDRRQQINARHVMELLPRTVDRLRHVSAEQWAERVNKKLELLGAIVTCRQARAQFLELLHNWQLFGSTFFYISNVTDNRVQGECLLAVNKHGVQFLRVSTHEPMLEFRLSEVLSTHKVTATPQSGGPPVHFLDMKVGNLLQQRVITLQSEQGSEISRLLGQYIYVDSQNRGVIATDETEAVQEF